MTLFPLLRDDARRTGSSGPSTAPAPVAVPLLAAILTLGVTAVVASLAGLPAWGVLAAVGVAGVVGGVLARRSLGSVASGVTLLIVRPYARGEQLRLYVPEQRGHVEAEIVRVGLANTTLATGDGLLVVPNSRLLHDIAP